MTSSVNKLSLIHPDDLSVVVENYNLNPLSIFDIGLKFPFATVKTYVIPFTTAINSEFVKNVIYCDIQEEDIYNIKNPSYKEIEIPLSLYKNLREVDIELFFNLWKGSDTVASSIIGQQNLNDLAQFSRAMLMNNSLFFVQYLENKVPYEPNTG